MPLRIGSTGADDEVEVEYLDVEDWALIINALVSWAGPPDGWQSSESERCWELVEAIERGVGLPAVDILDRADQ